MTVYTCQCYSTCSVLRLSLSMIFPTQPSWASIPKTDFITHSCVLLKQQLLSGSQLLASNFFMTSIIMGHLGDATLLGTRFGVLDKNCYHLLDVGTCTHVFLMKSLPQYCEAPAMILVLQKWWLHSTQDTSLVPYLSKGARNWPTSEWPKSLSSPYFSVIRTTYFWLLMNVRATSKTRELLASP